MEHSDLSICVVGNQRYIHCRQIYICGLFGEENHERKSLLVFFSANTEQRKEDSNNLKKVFSWSRSKINKSNLTRFQCKKNKPIKKHICSSLFFFPPFTNNDCQGISISTYLVTFVNKTELRLQFLIV